MSVSVKGRLPAASQGPFHPGEHPPPSQNPGAWGSVRVGVVCSVPTYTTEKRGKAFGEEKGAGLGEVSGGAEWNPDKVIRFFPSPSFHVHVSFSYCLVESPTTSRIPVSLPLFSDVLIQSEEQRSDKAWPLPSSVDIIAFRP